MIIKEKQRSFDNKVQGSQNWKDAKLQLAKKHERTVNQFKHYARQEVNKIVRKHDVIKVEDLNIGEMLIKKAGDGKRSLRRNLLGAKLGITLKIIAEAAEIATRQLVRVNPRNTTQTCSDCGKLLKEKLKLNQRIFKCCSCDLELDRDINSARNILVRSRDGFD